MAFEPLRGILCCGNISFDIPVWPVDRFEWGTTLWVEHIRENVGGNGANTSYALAKLGGRVRLAGVVGDDSHGTAVLDMLRAAGVDISSVSRSPKPTNTSICVVHPHGERLFLHQRGASFDLIPELIDLDRAVADGFTHFHLANVFAVPNIRPRAAELLASARRHGLSTSLDVGWDADNRWMLDVGPCLPHVDLFFVNETEARKLTDQADPTEAAEALHACGATTVLLKLGSAGCLIVTEDARIQIPAYSVTAVDTTGAGDCFAGATLAGLYHQMPLSEAVRLANAVGALNVQKLGSITGLLDLPGTLRWMEEQSISSSR